MLSPYVVIFGQFLIIVAEAIALFAALHFYSAATSRRYTGETFFERTPGGYRIGRRVKKEVKPVKVKAHDNNGRAVPDYERNKPRPTGRGGNRK